MRIATSCTGCSAAATSSSSNLAPGRGRQRLGFDAASLENRHPRLVAVEISGYGADGPLSGKRAYDLLVQAESGVCATTGTAGAPAKAGPPSPTPRPGLYAAFAALAALRERDRTGRGTTISVSMFDTMVEFMGYPLTFTRHTGVTRNRSGWVRRPSRRTARTRLPTGRRSCSARRTTRSGRGCAR